MILAFKIILLLIMILSFMGAIADSNEKLRNSMTAICIASILATTVAFIGL